MRLAIIFIMCAATTASAEPWSFDMPAGFKEKPGVKDPFVDQARKAEGTVGVDAKIYVKGDARLVRLLWRFKPSEPATRSMLDKLDKELVAKSPYAANRVSAVRVWYGEQMVFDGFEMTEPLEKLDAFPTAEAMPKPRMDTDPKHDRTRVYHRRFYAADRSGVVHVFWTICSGPADQIGTCEQAQQTMRLALLDEAPLPQGEAIAPPPLPPDVPQPWSFVLPKGYTEIPGATAALNEKLKRDGFFPAGTKAYRSPAGDVELIGSTTFTHAGFAPTRADLDRVVAVLLRGTKVPGFTHVSHTQSFAYGSLVLDQVDIAEGITVHQRHLIGMDESKLFWVFAITCLGRAEVLRDCEAAQDSMLLQPENQIDIAKLPEPVAPTKRRGVGTWSFSNVLGAASVVALIVGLGAWIYQSARRGGRRRRPR